MRGFGLHNSLKDVASAVAREVANKPFDPLPAQVLALLPLTSVSLCTLHQALLRGNLRPSPFSVILGVQCHILSASDKDSKEATTTKPSQRQKKSEGGGEDELDLVGTCKLMVQDLIQAHDDHRASEREKAGGVPEKRPRSKNGQSMPNSMEDDDFEEHSAMSRDMCEPQEKKMQDGPSSQRSESIISTSPSTAATTTSMTMALRRLKRERMEKGKREHQRTN
jgi:hypothetical protein